MSNTLIPQISSWLHMSDHWGPWHAWQCSAVCHSVGGGGHVVQCHLYDVLASPMSHIQKSWDENPLFSEWHRAFSELAIQLHHWAALPHTAIAFPPPPLQNIASERGQHFATHPLMKAHSLMPHIFMFGDCNMFGDLWTTQSKGISISWDHVLQHCMEWDHL